MMDFKETSIKDWMSKSGNNISEYFDKLITEARHKPRRSFKLPDGIYAARIKRILTRINDDGDLKLSWGFEITEGDHTLSTTWKNTNLAHPKAFGYLARDLKTCGIDYEWKLEDLDELLQTLTGKEVTIKLVTNENGYQAHYIQKMITNFPF